MTRVRSTELWKSALFLLSGTVVTLIGVVGLQWGRPVLIPIALAILLTFLLNPGVRYLQRKGLGLRLAVLLTVAAAGILITSAGGLVTRQLTILVRELPQNTANIKEKVHALRQLRTGPLVAQFAAMFEEISRDVPLPTLAVKNDENPKSNIEKTIAAAPAATIFVETPPALWLGLTGYLSSAFEVLATLALTFVLLIFFLLGRDELRDRIVMLAGNARLTVTSKALEDVTERVSRYIMTVAILNGGFGTLVALGLYGLQVPYAMLWGFMTGIFRFIPYVGPWIGAVCPIAMSLATSDGWLQPMIVFGFIVVMELVANNIVEPLAFGQSTGVSSTALIISAVFWMYLWGPIGLILSAPFAVCLLVLGKNIPQLAFLNLLLGSGTALRAHTGIYQRLMLGHEHEATRLILEHMKQFPSENVFDEMLIPALCFAKRDTRRGQLPAEDHELVLNGMQICLMQTDKFLQTAAELRDHQRELSPLNPSKPLAPMHKTVRILGCPADDETDSVALEMLRQLIDPHHWELELTGADTLTSELAAMTVANPPAAIFIAALPPGGMAHARYLCKRLRDASPDVLIIVGRWARKRNLKLEREQLKQAGASFVTTTLLETQQLLESRLLLLAEYPGDYRHVRLIAE